MEKTVHTCKMRTISGLYHGGVSHLEPTLEGSSAPDTRFQSLLEVAPDPIVIVDMRGAIAIVNRQTELTFGYAREELLGQPVEVLVPDDLRPVHTADRQRYTAEPITRPMGVGLELFGRRKDGGTFPVEISLSPLHAEAGTLIVSIIRDITSRKLAEEQLRAAAAELERSNRELEQFAYVASHDLQEPLRMVASYTQLLARRYKGKLDADADEFIGFAVDGARRMQELINDLLTYSRVGSRALELQSVDTGLVVDRVVADLAGAIEDSGGQVSHAELPTIRADAMQIQQLFQNLIANGLKFRRPDVPPEVLVSARRSTGAWTFAVSDNGIGIEPQYLERIFVLFQRLHSRAEYPGTGIGLAICKKIVERHAGTLTVHSEPGQGTTFEFTLPDRGAT
jgi:PAS domain S-box-containing protein